MQSKRSLKLFFGIIALVLVAGTAILWRAEPDFTPQKIEQELNVATFNQPKQ